MRLLSLAIIVTVAATAGFAQGWSLTSGDTPFTDAELAALPGQELVFYDDGISHYLTDGAYAYTYSAANGGGTAWGSYRVETDGSVCVAFINGAERCDLLVRNGDRVILINEDGARFPVRP